MLAIQDDILKAMKRGEVTIAVMADFSKAFDTVAYETVLRKFHYMGFSKNDLRWIGSYLTDRRQYVQENDRQSERKKTNRGVPQGSILGPVLFNLHLNDLSEALRSNFNSHLYADDTRIYRHCIPSDLQSNQMEVQAEIDKPTDYSKECNLELNLKKTKVMLLSTAQMARFHRLDEISMNLFACGRVS